MLHSSSTAIIFMGDKIHAVNKDFFNDHTAQSCLQKEPLKKLTAQLNLKACFTLHQTHSADGITVTEEELCKNALLGSKDGDFLITNLAHVGLFIKTADCLPIIIIDSHNKAVGIAHAGWKGSVQNIGTIMLNAMHNTYGTKTSNVEIYFGASAAVCCYKVQEPFIKNLDQTVIKKTITYKNNKSYFNLSLYNQILLERASVPLHAFKYNYHRCTICNPLYCSYRRDKESDLRQITLVSLK